MCVGIVNFKRKLRTYIYIKKKKKKKIRILWNFVINNKFKLIFKLFI